MQKNNIRNSDGQHEKIKPIYLESRTEIKYLKRSNVGTQIKSNKFIFLYD